MKVYEVITRIDDYGNIHTCKRTLLVNKKPVNYCTHFEHCDVYNDYFIGEDEADAYIERKHRWSECFPKTV